MRKSLHGMRVQLFFQELLFMREGRPERMEHELELHFLAAGDALTETQTNQAKGR